MMCKLSLSCTTEILKYLKFNINCSVLDNCICEMKSVTESQQKGIKTCDHFYCTLTLGEASINWESNPQKNTRSVLGTPYHGLLRSAGATEKRAIAPTPPPCCSHEVERFMQMWCFYFSILFGSEVYLPWHNQSKSSAEYNFI